MGRTNSHVPRTPDRPRVAREPLHVNDRNRSLTSSHANALIGPSNVYVSLQVPSEPSLDHPAPNLLEIGEGIADWDDTAAIVACLDVVVTVDTAVAHLAGAMGKPVFLLLPYCPDWRWGIRGNNTPWYPTMRLFRQPHPGDWAAVTAAVRQAVSGSMGFEGLP